MLDSDTPPDLPDKKGLNKKKTKNKTVENVEINNLNNPPTTLAIPLMRIPITIFSVNAQALVDTGTAASFISLELLKKLPNDKVKEKERFPALVFRTVSGETIKSKGMFELSITISGKHVFTHVFYVLEKLNEGCILGIDFLTKHGVAIDPKNRRLLLKAIEDHVLANLPDFPLYSIKVEPDDSLNFPQIPIEYLAEVKSLIMRHKHLFADKMPELGMATAVKHTINLDTTRPINLPLRRTPEALKLTVRTQIEEMVQHNIIRESTSPYAAPVVMVPKKGGEMRFCIDYRQLNKATVKDRYPLPRIDDTIDALYGAKYFSTLDLFSGYWQIEIEESDKHKTAFICEYGQYEFNRMPFGLTNAPGTFQRLMNKIMKPVLYESALVYLDDIIVFSKTLEDHIKHLETVFKILAEAGLKLKLKKCDFFKTEINYLGHIVSRDGVMPNSAKIEAITNYPEPTNAKELSSFLGLASYYRKFIRAFAEKAHPLTKLTRKNEQWTWGDEQRDAFRCIKDCLVSKPILGYPDFSREFIIYTDASGYGIGAVLAQLQRPPHSSDENDREVVIAYSSKHLNDREAKWSTTEKEAYAIIHAINVFKPYLYGRQFTVVTDHRPLEWLMSKNEPAGRLARWALKIQEYNIKIGYRAGKLNQNADCLSRTPPPLIATITPKYQTEWADAQREDEYCKAIIESLENENPQTLLNFQLTENKELLDKHGRLIVPVSKKQEVMELNHDHMLAGHLGIAKTMIRVQKQFTWPHLREDVTAYINGCLICARRKSYGASKAPLHPMPPVDRVWEKIAMDIVGPVQESRKGNKFILVLSDYASRFVFTIPMKDQTARTVAQHFVDKIVTKYGALEQVLTDQGSNFLSKLTNEICTLFKIKQLKTTSYHPQTDGLVERFNRTLGDMLACYVNQEPDQWDIFLPFVTLAYNTAKQATLKENPFYLFYGREAILPNEIMLSKRYRFEEDLGKTYSQQWQRAFDLTRNHLLQAQAKQKSYYDDGSRPSDYQVDDLVLLRVAETQGKFGNNWEGPFRVTKVLSDLTYEIARLHIVSNRQLNIQTVHCNRLKKYLPRNPNIFNSPHLEPHNTGPIRRVRNKHHARVQPRTHTTPVVPSDQHSNTQPRKRGRPPKVSQKTAISISQPEKIVKRRGRPPKTVRPNVETTYLPLKTDRPRVAYRNLRQNAIPYRNLRSHNTPQAENRSQSNKINVQVFNNQPNPEPNPHTTNRYNLRTVVPRPQRF